MAIAIFGIGTLAKLAHYYITKDMKQKVSAFVIDKDKNQGNKSSTFQEIPILFWDEFINSHNNDEYKMFIAVAYKRMRNRLEVFERVKSYNYSLLNIVSSSSFVSEDSIQGENNFIMPGAVLEPGSKIGSNNLIWSNSTICHDSQIGNHNFFGANFTMGGRSRVGDLCFFGFSSTITDNIQVNNEVILAANSFLNKDAKSLSRYQGVPAKKYSRIEEKKGIIFFN
ncbi:MAG: hypothetical protein CMK49_01050 [Prochlorococcus sp. SP3034]|nr:hypothetical protein [Prochlorococcus sp. SP3034]|tara:strand:- start:651 stop:1325 length:675 start_codon:yes stop_codon:yes gene_type:complete